MRIIESTDLDSSTSRTTRRTVTDPTEPESTPNLEVQRRLISDWLQSADALRVAGNLVLRHRISSTAGDLVHDAWLKLGASVDRRTGPYPELTNAEQAARFGSRMLDNLARDVARRTRRQGEVELVGQFAVVDESFARVEHRHLLEMLIASVGRRASRLEPCPGCPSEVVVAVALELVHLALSGSEGAPQGRTWLDRMLFLALERVEGDTARTTAARNQRKSRCGRCATELLELGMSDLMEERS